MTNARRDEAILFLGGIVLMIAGVGRLVNQVHYLPGDMRNEPWFYPVTSGILIVGGILAWAHAIRRHRRGGQSE